MSHQENYNNGARDAQQGKPCNPPKGYQERDSYFKGWNANK